MPSVDMRPATQSLHAVSMILVERLRRETIGRRNEFGADGITDRLLENPVDLVHRCLVDVPAYDVGDRRELTRAACAPQGDIAFAAIEHPARGQVNHPPAEAVLRELVEFLHRGEILLVSRFAKL